MRITVPTSAYRAAFPPALASWGIPPPCRIRLTPALLESDTGLLRSSSPFGAVCRPPLFAGFRGGVSGSAPDPPSPYPCPCGPSPYSASACPTNDDSHVDSFACPCTALRDGIPSRILGDRLFSPLCGLRISRYRRGDAVTSTPEGQELHPHGDEVIKDPMISILYPLSFHEER